MTGTELLRNRLPRFPNIMVRRQSLRPPLRSEPSFCDTEACAALFVFEKHILSLCVSSMKISTNCTPHDENPSMDWCYVLRWCRSHDSQRLKSNVNSILSFLSTSSSHVFAPSALSRQDCVKLWRHCLCQNRTAQSHGSGLAVGYQSAEVIARIRGGFVRGATVGELCLVHEISQG